MRTNKTLNSTLACERPGKIYSSSVLRVARHFWRVENTEPILSLADEMQRHPDIPAVCVVDDQGRIEGIIRRDNLFALIGKPFGREVLGRSVAAELCEKVDALNANADIFAVAQSVVRNADNDEVDYYPLSDGSGRFKGILSSQDLSNYLSKITGDDIELAGKLQERLLASNEPLRGADWGVDAWSRSAKGVGGDFYFCRELPGGKIFCALCDVSGKGVAASVIVSMVWGMLRMYDFQQGLKNLIVQLNRSVVTTFHMEKYLTGFFMVLDPETKQVICADMGHSHVALLRNGKGHRVRGKTMNLPIGVEAVIDPAINTFKLSPADALLVYSDGVTEQESENGEEFGEARLAGAIKDTIRSGKKLQDTIPLALDAYRGDTPQQDDMSCLLLVLGPQEPGTEQ